MADDVEIGIPSDPRWLCLIRSMVDEFAREAGFDSQERWKLTVAASEAVSNIIKHAYKGDSSRRLTVHCRESPGGVEFEIRHGGEPFDPGQVEVGPPEELRAGGRGLYLMRTIMDELEYRNDGGVCSVRMKKLLRAPAR